MMSSESESLKAERVLAERLKRSGLPQVSRDEGRQVTVTIYDDGARDTCPSCFAAPDEACISMRTGRALPGNRTHRLRQRSRTVARFQGDGNRMTVDGVAEEAAYNGMWEKRLLRKAEALGDVGAAGLSSLDRLRYDPPESSIIPVEGAYVTFVGSPVRVEGAHSSLRPGDTYYAVHAPGTREGWDRYGQFLVYFDVADKGPVYLFPYEYVVLQPDHLWFLVQDGALKFTPRNMDKGTFGDKVHYLRSRGIALERAVLMCLGEVRRDIGSFAPVEIVDAMWWKLQSVGLTPMQKQAMADALAAAEAA